MGSDAKTREKVWRLVTIAVDRDAEEFANSVLFELGTSGTVVFEEGQEQLRLGAYFDEQTDAEQIGRRVESEFIKWGRRRDLRDVSISTVAEEDWMQKWKEGFEPIEIGSRLIVAPSWKTPVNADGRAVVRIDPGMAFGTGTHETTRLCLGAIEKYWRGGSLLDVGTGTGILAIAAALLAPDSRIFAIDIDPQAAEIARGNAAINGVAGSIDISEDHLGAFAGRDFNIVVANLTAEVIVDLMTALVSCVAPSGLLIASGILTELVSDVDRAAIEAGLAIIDRNDAGEWSGIVAKRR